MPTLKEIEAALPVLESVQWDIAAERGRAILSLVAMPSSMACDLPIRHYRTGEVLAYVPHSMAGVAIAVVRNGYAVAYYRPDALGREYPSFASVDGRMVVRDWRLMGSADMMPVFADGAHIGDVLC